MWYLKTKYKFFNLIIPNLLINDEIAFLIKNFINFNERHFISIVNINAYCFYPLDV